MSRIALLLTIPLLALTAAPAAAKELGKVSICGADGCVDRTAGATHAVLETGSVRAAPRKAEPYYVVRIGIAEEMSGKVVHRFDTRWLPRAGLLRGADGVWMTALARTQRELRRLSAGIEPRPAGSRPPKAPANAPLQDDGGPLPAGGDSLPPEVVSAPPAREEDRGGDGGGPSAMLVAAPAALLLGLATLAARRRRRGRGV